MARFNFDPVPTVAPTGAPGNDYEHIPTSPAMFGGSIAGAEEKLGQGVESAGNAGLDYQKAKQGLTNEISASETNTWLAKNLTDKFNDFGRLQGKAAQDALPQFKQDTEDLYEQTIKNAGGNLQMQSMLARSGRVLTDRYYQLGTQHADGQWRTWQNKTFDDRATEFGNQAAVFAQHGTWDDVDMALHTSDDEVRKKLEAQHLDGDSIKAEVAKRRGTNVKNIVDTLSNNGDPRTAQAIFDKYKDGMDAGSVLAVSSHLKGLNAQLDGHTIADEETGRIPRGGPQVNDAINKAASETGLDPAMLRRIARIESGGNPNAQTGSYKGLFQLSDAEFKQYGGGDINDPRDNARAASRKLAAESQEFEKQYGRAPTGSELYMIHQQGAGGFAAHMATPDAPAWQNMASTAEGRSKGEAWAKAAIWGNVPDRDKAAFGSVDKITSRQFLNLWQAKVGGEAGGALPDKAEVFDRILARTDGNPRAQAAAISRMNQIYSVERADQTQNKVLFDQRQRDEKAESFDTGKLSTKTPLTESDFVQRYGPLEGSEKYREHADDIDLGAKVMAAAGMTPEQRNDLIPQPQPGPGYARALQRRAEFDTAMKRLDTQRKEDPAGLALKRLPDVRAAYQGMAQVENDKQSTDDQKRIARANFAATMHDEQSRIGIDPQEQRLLPKDSVDALNARFATAADSEDPQARIALVAGVRQEAALWGDNWPQVMRQLAPQTRPLVRAIAAGADPEAMTRLLRLDKTDTPATILKEQNETTPKKVENAVNDAMAPYQRTLMPVQRDKEGKGYSNLAEQLAALHVRDDKDDPDVAAKKAFNELVGNRFEFKDTWRIPKSAGISADEVQAGTGAARLLLAELGAKPPVDDLPGRTAGAIPADMTLVGRNGTWITAPDNSGLNLVYDFVGPDGIHRQSFLKSATNGKALVVPWAELAKRGRALIGEQAEAGRVPDFR